MHRLADKELMAFEAPDLALYHGASVDVEQATKLALEAEKAALEYDEKLWIAMVQALIHILACVFMVIHMACYKVTYLAAILYLVRWLVES